MWQSILLFLLTNKDVRSALISASGAVIGWLISQTQVAPDNATAGAWSAAAGAWLVNFVWQRLRGVVETPEPAKESERQTLEQDLSKGNK
jgi:hypothetical protein